MESLYDDPENTYGYLNFMPHTLETLEEDDNLVTSPPEVDAYTNIDDDSLNVESLKLE